MPVHDGRHCGFVNTGSKSSGSKWTGFSTTTTEGGDMFNKETVLTGARFAYKYQGGCVSGMNLEQLKGVTFQQCAKACDDNADCKGIEFWMGDERKSAEFSSSYGSEPDKVNCNVSGPSISTEGCETAKYNMELFVPVNLMDYAMEEHGFGHFGVKYRGFQVVTRSGATCARWDA